VLNLLKEYSIATGMRIMNENLRENLRQKYSLDYFIGHHAAFQSLKGALERVANSDLSVLLIGETGTGKGICAQFMHQYGNLFNRPFISYNCGAGPDTLFESQIFGHVKGAFTGANADRIGLVEEADTGILFLDELNSLSPYSQVKLNHFLEKGYFRRVGENKIRKANVRIIGASNVDLRKEVRKGNFRADLYFRLAEYELQVPPLRARGDDIILLAEHFLRKYEYLSNNGSFQFTQNALRQLLEYDWPGNIRELEHCIKRCMVDAPSSLIHAVPLPYRTPNGNESEIETPEATPNHLYLLGWKEAKAKVISQFEKDYLETLLQQFGGNVSRCARHAGIHPPDFWKLLRRYNIKAHDFRNGRL
jgi:two-component system response regulator GlrR